MVVTFEARTRRSSASPRAVHRHHQPGGRRGATARRTSADDDTAEPWFLANSAGSGPFQLESYTEGEALVLARNDNYWGDRRAVFPKVTFKQVKDAIVAAPAAAAGRRRHRDADHVRLGRPARRRRGRSRPKIVDSYNFVYIALSPGAAGGENLQDPNVREAIR